MIHLKSLIIIFKIKGHFEDFPIDKYVAANVAKNHVVVVKDMDILNNLYKLQKKRIR